MSGHSHAKTVKRVKEANAQKRNQIFSKIARVISVAAKDGGPNPESNAKLRAAIETAKSFNMPKDNIERAIKSGSGELAGEKLEEITLEALGPEGIALIVEGISDNKNRALSEVKQILNQNGAKLVAEGAVKWMFEKKGAITINFPTPNFQTKEQLELAAIEAGAGDVRWRDNTLELYTNIEDLEKVKITLKEKGVEIESSSIDWVPKEEMEVSEKTKESCQALFNSLDENDAVQDIYSNLKI